MTLGYLNPDTIAGGTVALDADAARAALRKQVADPLGMPLLEAAYGVLSIAIATMTRAVKAVTTYRGRDPRDFALACFGGNGPVTAAAIARALKIPRVLVPPAPGVFSAAGLLFSAVEHELGRTSFLRGEALSRDVLERDYAQLEEEVTSSLVAEGYARERIGMSRFAEMRYSGQAYELAVDVPAGAIDVGRLVAGFHAEHERTYGHVAETDPVDVVSVRVLARVAARENGSSEARDGDAEQGGARAPRNAYFGPEHGMLEAAVIGRDDLADRTLAGPLLVDEYDATCVIPPGCRARLDPFGNIEMTIEGD